MALALARAAAPPPIVIVGVVVATVSTWVAVPTRFSVSVTCAVMVWTPSLSVSEVSDQTPPARAVAVAGAVPEMLTVTMEPAATVVVPEIVGVAVALPHDVPRRSWRSAVRCR